VIRVQLVIQTLGRRSEHEARSIFVAASLSYAEDAAAIMAKVAANMEHAVDARRQHVYQPTVRATLSKTGPTSTIQYDDAGR
jgi:hypothetical protein